MGVGGIFTKAFAGGFFGKLAETLFIAVCLALGFGPDEWAKFIMTGLPIGVTPVLAQAVFLTLAALTFGALTWSFLARRRADIESNRSALIAQARDFVSKTVRQNPDDIHFQNQLESDQIFYILRPHLSDHFNQALMGRVALYPSRPGATLPQIARLFIAEIERLEKEWNLT
jgi:hypothetical protein